MRLSILKNLGMEHLDAPKKIYWDSCVWLALINEEVGRVERCKYVISEARKGNVQIWTSTLTLAEVFRRKCSETWVELPESKDSDFENYLEQEFFVVAQLDVDLGVLSRRLLRQHSELKKPPDGIHLATAAFHNVDEMHTFDDENLTPLSGKINRSDGVALVICHPPEDPEPLLI